MRINRLLPLLAVWLCLTTHAVAAESRIIAVLPFDVRQASGKMDESSRVFLEEAVRDSAIKLLSAEGWTVLSGETTLQVLLDNGVDAQKCGDQTCHLSMAREIKAEKFISGSVQFVEGKFSAFVRMIESKTGKIIASERLMGGTVTSLQEQFEAKAATFFQVIRATTTVVTSAGEVAAKSVPAALPSESRTTPAKTIKGWIGLGMRDSELTLKQRALVGRARAPTLTWPVPGGPAEKANLQWDDILVSINSRSYETAADAAAAIEAIGPDQEISLGYLRGDEVFSVSLKTEIPLEERAIGEREKDVRTLEALLGIRVLGPVAK